MRTVFTLILTIFFYSLQAQTTTTKDVSTDKKQAFRNQGEHEDYWTGQFFGTDYVKRAFDPYKGDIITNGDSIKYSNHVFIVFDTPKELKSIFTKGIFYPTIITGQTRTDTLTISNFEEVPALSKTRTQKRFRFWLHRKGLRNPTVCFIELTNQNATDKTDISTFIDGAQLTFFKAGWIII